MNVYHHGKLERIVIAGLTVLWGLTLMGCSTSKPSMSFHPSSRKSESYGYLHTAEAQMGDTYNRDVKLTTTYVKGVRFDRGRWVTADGTPSITRLYSSYISCTMVLDREYGVIDPKVAIHEFKHAIMFSRPSKYPTTNDGQHSIMKQKGCYP